MPTLSQQRNGMSARAAMSMIERDLNATNDLLAALTEESEALASHDRQRILSILTRKQTSLQTLEQSAVVRKQWLNSLCSSLQNPTHETQQQCWEDWLNAQGGPGLVNDWQQLSQRLLECRHHNEQNGKVIARSQRTVHQLLDILRGKSQYEEQLYTAKGISRQSGIGTTVAKA